LSASLTANDNHLIKMDEFEGYTVNGEKLQFDTKFDRYGYQTRSGTIHDSATLPKGSRVYVHYFIADKLIEGFGLHYTDDSLIYAYSHDGKVTMMEDYVFVQPVDISESSEHIIYSEKKEAGKILFLPEITNGLEEGDIIRFTEKSDLKMTIEGVEGYLMRMDRDIVCHKDYTCIGSWMLVEALDESEWREEGGLLLPGSAPLHVGKVKHGKDEGKSIVYPKKSYNMIDGMYAIKENHVMLELITNNK